jgi:drug/metabolite transporter (DMT)-like permease
MPLRFRPPDEPAASRVMGWDVTIAVLAAAAVHAGWNAMIKHGRDPLYETTLAHAWIAVPALVAVMLLPAPGPIAALCVVGSSMVHVLYHHAMSAAYRSGDLSFAYPIMRGTAPMLTALLAVPLLGETPPAAAWGGIFAISAGGLAIGMASARSDDRDARRRSFGWAMLTSGTIVVYTLLDSVGARHAPSPWSYVAWLALVEGPLMLVVVALRHGVGLTAYARVRGAGPLFIGLASMGSYAVALWAMTRAPVAMVAALRETSVLFALLIAYRFMGERVPPMRWAGAASIVAGIAALRLA